MCRLRFSCRRCCVDYGFSCTVDYVYSPSVRVHGLERCPESCLWQLGVTGTQRLYRSRAATWTRARTPVQGLASTAQPRCQLLYTNMLNMYKHYKELIAYL